MAEKKLFGRADLAALDGVGDDALQFWLREGILHPEPAEPRKHRRFSPNEARIAALLGEARQMGLNISALRALAEGVREALAFRSEIQTKLGGSPTLNDEAELVENDCAPADFERLMLAWTFGFGDGDIGLSFTPGEGWRVRSFSSGVGQSSRSELVLNVTEILSQNGGLNQ